MSEEKLEPKYERHKNLLHNFLFLCAGADKSILNQCPTEWNKYACIGATILFTGILACLSGGYALYTVFRGSEGATLFAVLFGLLWGMIIFNLDRFIVSTFRKVADGKWWQKFLRELLHASPRIILAIIIAIVISKPVEIKIFENRLFEQINLNKKDAIDKNNDFYLNINKIDDRKNNVKTIKDNIDTLEKKLNIDPPKVKNLEADKILAEKELEELSDEKESHQQAIIKIKKDEKSYKHNYDDNGNIIVSEELTWKATEEIDSHENTIETLNGKIKNKKNKVKDLKQQIEDIRKKYNAEINKQIKQEKSKKHDADSILNNAEAKADKETLDANKLSEKAFSNNFISQIEALGNLTSSDNTMRTVNLFLTLLFLTIELAPILTKMITKRGPYEEILDRTEYELMIEQRSIMCQKGTEIKKLLEQAEDAAKLRVEIINRIEKDKVDTELKTNKKLLEKIAAKQEVLAEKYIDKWYADELKKL